MEAEIERLERDARAAIAADIKAARELGDLKENAEYHDVSSHEADAAAGKLSVDSPVAQALRGRRAGQTVSVPAPRGERLLRIVSVS